MSTSAVPPPSLFAAPMYFMDPQDTPLREVNYFTKNPERAARMESWSGIIKDFQDSLTGMPEEDKMRLPGKFCLSWE